MHAKTSRAMRDVWEMKRVTEQETRHLSGREYFAYLRRRVEESYAKAVPRVRLDAVKQELRQSIAAEPVAAYHARHVCNGPAHPAGAGEGKRSTTKTRRTRRQDQSD